MTEEEFVARAINQADEQNGGAPYDLVVTGKHARAALFDRARAAIRAVDEYRAVPIVGEVE